MVGGTGLYFKALTQGLAAVPPIPAGIRAAVRDRLEAEGIAALYAELCDRDPATAQRSMPGIAPASPARSRWSWRPGARSPTGTAKAWNPQLDPDSAVKIFLDADRAELYRRIDARFDAMLRRVRWRRCARSASALSTLRCPP